MDVCRQTGWPYRAVGEITVRQHGIVTAARASSMSRRT